MAPWFVTFAAFQSCGIGTGLHLDSDADTDVVETADTADTDVVLPARCVAVASYDTDVDGAPNATHTRTFEDGRLLHNETDSIHLNLPDASTDFGWDAASGHWVSADHAWADGAVAWRLERTWSGDLPVEDRLIDHVNGFVETALYQWDTDGKLQWWAMDSDSSGVPEQEYTFAYDVDGHLESRSFDVHHDGTIESVEYFSDYDGEMPQLWLMDADADGAPDFSVRFAYDDYGNTISAEADDDLDGNVDRPTLYTAEYDLDGNVVGFGIDDAADGVIDNQWTFQYTGDCSGMSSPYWYDPVPGPRLTP